MGLAYRPTWSGLRCQSHGVSGYVFLVARVARHWHWWKSGRDVLVLVVVILDGRRVACGVICCSSHHRQPTSHLTWAMGR